MASKSSKSSAKTRTSSQAAAQRSIRARDTLKSANSSPRVFDARPDTLDFRDFMFVPTLVEVPTNIPLTDYLAFAVPVLDQGQEGACTGFGLATVANYLLIRRQIIPDRIPVSPRMFYEMARRYDEWPGENYEGSSARGAMKGWHQHGVCAEADFPYTPDATGAGGLNDKRTSEALKRPLGAYYRVNHKDLIAMHAALAEVGVLYATATVHDGWNHVGADGIIQQQDLIIGGHAFAIVAYDGEGFWIQNSWGLGWGKGGMCRISYDDWLANGTDIWVARLGAPVTLKRVASTAVANAPTSGQTAAYSYADLRPHIVSLGNNGELKPGGSYGTSRDDLGHIMQDDIPRVTKGWKKPRILLYAHGGLVGRDAAAQRLAEYRPAMLDAEVYPLSFIWHTDWWSTMTNILQDAIRRHRPEGSLTGSLDFLLDRLDDFLEPIARTLSGLASWREMKENALGASEKGHGVALVAEHLKEIVKSMPELEVHVVGHSAGSILLGPLVASLNASGMPVKTCTLWAPACTMALYHKYYEPAIISGGIDRFTLFTLSDQSEQDDNCAQIYHKSLLYLVSNALEDEYRMPPLQGAGAAMRPRAGRGGVPLLGMAKFVEVDAALTKLFSTGRASWVLAPNQAPEDSALASHARHHGDFDDDAATVNSTLSIILGARPKSAKSLPSRAFSATAMPKLPEGPQALAFAQSENSLQRRRRTIDLQTKPMLR